MVGSFNGIEQMNLGSVCSKGNVVIGLRSKLVWLLVCCFVVPALAFGEPVSAHHKQGSNHGFLLLKSSDGKVIAVGDQITEANGAKVRSRLTFHFRDGSIDDEDHRLPARERSPVAQRSPHSAWTVLQRASQHGGERSCSAGHLA